MCERSIEADTRGAPFSEDAPRVGWFSARSLLPSNQSHTSTACRISACPLAPCWRSELADRAIHPIARATALLRGHAVVVRRLRLEVFRRTRNVVCGWPWFNLMGDVAVWLRSLGSEILTPTGASGPLRERLETSFRDMIDDTELMIADRRNEQLQHGLCPTVFISGAPDDPHSCDQDQGAHANGADPNRSRAHGLT